MALLLPLSGSLANAGQAVRDGFVAAFFHAGSQTTIRIYDTNGNAVTRLYEKACSDGAQLVIGPLDKSGVAEINAVPNRPVPVLALNYLPPGVAATGGLFQFGLSIEDEARAIARRIYEDGLRRVADHRVRSRLVDARRRVHFVRNLTRWAERWSASV